MDKLDKIPIKELREGDAPPAIALHKEAVQTLKDQAGQLRKFLESRKSQLTIEPSEYQKEMIALVGLEELLEKKNLSWGDFVSAVSLKGGGVDLNNEDNQKLLKEAFFLLGEKNKEYSLKRKSV